MSSGEVGGGEQRYFCHQCQTVITPIREELELICPLCHGGFVEEMEGHDNPVHVNLAGQGVGGGTGGGFEAWHAAGGGNPLVFGGGGDGGEELMNHIMENLTSFFHQGAGAGAGAGAVAGAGAGAGAVAGAGAGAGAVAGAGAGAAAGGIGRGPLNPMMMMQGRLQNLLGGGGGGGNIQIIFEGGGGGGGERLAGNIGDYFWGQGLEQLIQQLAENDPNRYGTPPASKAAVEAMPTIVITQDHLNSDASQCAVCKDNFEEGANAREMPCKHMYHEECILPWLQQHSTCPVCRYAMPTDDSQQGRPTAAQAAHNPVVNSSANPRGNTNSEGAGVGAGAGAERDLVSWNAMIGAYAQNGQAHEALGLFTEMQLTEMVPDAITVKALLPACAHLTALQQGKSVHGFVIRSGLLSEVSVGNSLIDMYGKSGNVEFARQLFEEMSKRNVVSWSAMIAAYGMHGDGQAALALFAQMKQMGIAPDDVTFICILSACSHSGLVDEGRRCFDSMVRDFRIKPRVEHYACLVDIRGRAGKLDEARDLIENMPLKPDAGVWGALLSACIIHGDIKLGERATEHILNLDHRNPGRYVQLSNIYAVAGRWDDVANVREIMKEIGLEKAPGCSMIEQNSRVHAFLMGSKSYTKTEKNKVMLESLAPRI